MRKEKISIADFCFEKSGFGHYVVTYTSPVTGRYRSCVTDNMLLIDATKNSEHPKVKDLNILKRICKEG